MRKVISIVVVAFVCVGFAQSSMKHLRSKIEHVLVFFDGAQITRSAQVNLSKGITELYFDSLSTKVNENSIQFKSNMDLTILGISFDTKKEKDKKLSAEIAVLENKQRALGLDNEYFKSQMANLDDEYAFIQTNNSIGGTQSGVAVQNFKATADFMRVRLQELLDKKRELRNKIKVNNAAIVELSRALVKKQGVVEYQFGVVRVKVQSEKAGKVKMELSYLVNDASWSPTYDMRLKDITKPLQLTYKAEVAQSTGVDWKNVSISLSNGSPKMSNIIPELLPWNLDYNRAVIRKDAPVPTIKKKSSITVRGKVVGGNELLPGVSILIKGTANGTTTDFDGNFSLEAKSGDVLVFSYIGFRQVERAAYKGYMDVSLQPDVALLDEVVVSSYKKREKRDMGRRRSKSFASAPRAEMAQEVRLSQKTIRVEKVENQTSLQYNVETRYSIKSGAEAFSVDIKREAVAAEYQYAAIPKLEKEAYLIARIPDWAKYQLLDGPTNIYYEGTYMGQSRLNTDLLKDTMEVSIGRDKAITVSREKLTDYSSRKLFGSKRLVEFTYEIVVRNNKRTDIEIVLHDHYPIPRYEEIEVEQLDHSGAELDEKTKKMKWTLKVAPGETKKKLLKYSVKYPKKKHIYLD